MRRFLPCWWAATCLLVLQLTSGCQHSQPCQTTCDAPNGVVMGAPVAAPVESTPTAETPVPAPVPVVSGNTELSPAFRTVPTSVSAVPPLVPTTAKPLSPAAADPMLNLAPPPYPPASVPSEALRPVAHHSVTAAKERSPVPMQPAPRFGHDPNYHWLVGPVEYCRIQQAWLLRYVSVEEEDRYGGCVTLVAPDQPMNFKSGQIVRVEGSLIDPESRQLRPAFQVQTINAD